MIKLNVNEDDIYYYGKSNAFLQNISCYKKEEEVLIWKTRNFEKEKNIEEGTVFYFRLSNKYFEEIKKKYKS